MLRAAPFEMEEGIASAAASAAEQGELMGFLLGGEYERMFRELAATGDRFCIEGQNPEEWILAAEWPDPVRRDVLCVMEMQRQVLRENGQKALARVWGWSLEDCEGYLDRLEDIWDTGV